MGEKKYSQQFQHKNIFYDKIYCDYLNKNVIFNFLGRILHL